MKKRLLPFIILIPLTMLFGCFGNKKSSNYKEEKQKLATALMQYEWEHPDKVISLLEPNIYLLEKDSHKIGDSKFGGTPEVPANFEWPLFEGKPMTFFGQINFDQTAHLDIDNTLPKKGILYFFAYFDAPESEYGSAYNFQMEKEKYQVVFYDGNLNNLQKMEFPQQMPPEFHFKEMPVKFDLDFRLPPTPHTWKYKQLRLSEKDTELYETVIEEYGFCEGETLLGTPCPVQDAAEVDWSYAYLESTDYKNEDIKKQVQELCPDFINLLSFGMWDKFEVIGLSGCYFGIRKTDLKNRDFSKTVFIMQDT